MKSVFNWLDKRTGYRKIVKETLYEPVPGGARWRYVWGSTLSFGIMVQFITGIVLWAAYSPSSQTAWESVFYIQEEMTGGWILRGIHHYTAQAMTILLVLHLMQVLIDGAYKAPREVNFWTGLFLLMLVMGMSLTGYLLPWDQKGFWATKVATNLIGVVPFIGEGLQKVVIGGADYGHHTLTRFFALHAGVLPATMIAFIVGHVYLFRLHGITSKKPHKKRDGWFWPDQILMDAVACLAVLAAVLVLVFWNHGAELSAPADPAERFPARPDWYFMFLFQFLKYFPGKWLIVGGLVIPGVVFLVVLLFPVISRHWRRGHVFNLFAIGVLLAGFVYLTAEALIEDANSSKYQFAKQQAAIDAERVRELARSPDGIAPIGAVALLHEDPLTQGPRIFASKCASCHTYDGHNGQGQPQEEPSAPDLVGWGSREWLAGILDPELIETPKYFFGTKFVEPDEDGKKSRMVEYTHSLVGITDQGREELDKIIAVVSAEAELSSQVEMDAMLDEGAIEEGIDLFFSGIDGVSKSCGECHGFDGDESEAARTPDLTGWGSRDWTIRFTKNPEHADFYGSGNDRMPIFEEERIFTDRQIELVVDWLRGDWVRFGKEEEEAVANGP